MGVRRCNHLERRVTAVRLVCAIALVWAVVPIGSPAQARDGAVVVASKIDTEGALLGNMILALLPAHGVAVENKLQLGPTNIVRAAILAGQVDIYPEYTGNGALFFHREQDPAWKNWGRGYALVEALCREKNHLVWLDPGAGEQHLGDRRAQGFSGATTPHLDG